MQKIAIHTNFGGFDLPKKTWDRYGDLSGVRLRSAYDRREIKRNDPFLVKAIGENTDECKQYYNVDVVEIPDGVDWTIQEYDGLESIHENHRVWPL